MAKLTEEDGDAILHGTMPVEGAKMVLEPETYDLEGADAVSLEVGDEFEVDGLRVEVDSVEDGELELNHYRVEITDIKGDTAHFRTRMRGTVEEVKELAAESFYL